MANLFLGFPVPRAKIADMIAGSAPPSLHKTQHQNGGTDEIDCTGLVGAGGAGIPFEDLFISDMFASVDNYDISNAGSGSVVNYTTGIVLQTATTASSSARLMRSLWTQYPESSWDKDRKWRIYARFYGDTSSTGTWFAGTAYSETSRGLGFYIDDGKLYSHCHNGTTQTRNLLIDYGAGALSKSLTLSIDFDAGVSAKFYVDGVLKDTITTVALLPTGTDDADYPIYAKVTNKTQTLARTLSLSHLALWQAQ